jgi:hypothetical protein
VTAGVLIINDDGDILIDKDYPSLGLASKGNLSIAEIDHSNWTGTEEHGASLTVTGANPILALGGAYYSGIKAMTKSGSSWTFEVRAESAANGHTIPYYVFDNAKLVDEGFGLIVRNSSGDIVYSSSQKPARLMAIKEGTLSAGWPNAAAPQSPQSWAIGAGRTYAVTPLETASYYHWYFTTPDQPFEQWVETIYGTKATSNGVAAAGFTNLNLTGSNHDSEAGEFEADKYQFLIFDVTNY